MNRFMKSQINTVLLSMKTLDKSIEMSARKDDGKISREEQKEIRKIRKAIADFEKKMNQLL